MKDQKLVRIPVYLSRRAVRDCSGTWVKFAERRLVRRGPEDRVLAIIGAPIGSRVRRREDQHGHDHLVVPRGRSLWARWFGSRVSIPAKYVLSDARSRSYGLELLEFRPPSEPAEIPAIPVAEPVEADG